MPYHIITLFTIILFTKILVIRRMGILFQPPLKFERVYAIHLTSYYRVQRIKLKHNLSYISKSLVMHIATWFNFETILKLQSKNPFIDQDDGDVSLNQSAGTTLMLYATEYQHQLCFQLPASSPYDNFLKAAGCWYLEKELKLRVFMMLELSLHFSAFNLCPGDS